MDQITVHDQFMQKTSKSQMLHFLFFFLPLCNLVKWHVYNLSDHFCLVLMDLLIRVILGINASYTNDLKFSLKTKYQCEAALLHMPEWGNDAHYLVVK